MIIRLDLGSRSLLLLLIKNQDTLFIFVLIYVSYVYYVARCVLSNDVPHC